MADGFMIFRRGRFPADFSDGTALDLAMAVKDAIASAVWRAVCRKFLHG